VRRTRARPALHPELTLLLSTSGSTGSAKLVRLSYGNLESNARAIGEYLAIGPEDRAATTLPMYYCYGLSVIHSHLMRGASLLLTQASVADEGYWELFRVAGATSFAGVPHTFDLLDRVGFADMDLPDLRYVTQAGGRMDPEKVRRYARLGRERGWRLYVMYGQTEATARMAYLPPELVESRPECVGIAIPGGNLRIDPIPESPDPAVGELVYTGPNVMLGYAATGADLAAGPSVSELRTGDIARQHPDGLFEIVGRRSRFLKLFGLRVDLEQVEQHLARHGYPAACTGDDTTLRVAVSGTVAAAEIQRLVAQLLQVPSRVVDVRTGVDLPRTESGKVDYAVIARLFDDPPPASAPSAAPSDEGVRRIFVEVLERQDIRDDDTFVSLGGDSLSYVEMTVRLEQALGELPPDWHTTTLRDLDRRQAAGPRPGRRSWRRSIEGSLALRAASIALIVASHAGLVKLHGMALALLAAVGFNFARFTLSTDERRERVRRAATTAARMAAIALPVIVVVTALSPHYRFENYVFGDSLWLPYPYDWESHFWFIFAVLYFLLAMVVVVAVRGFTRIERRHRFAVPAVLMFVGLVARYQLIPEVTLPTPVKLFWLFAIGWAAASATHAWQRVLISIVTIVSLIDFVPNSPLRNNVAIICVLLLIWVTSVPTIGAVNWVAGLLAASSLSIYVTHWAILYQLSPLGLPPWILVVVALLVGVAYHQVAKRVLASVEEGLRRRRGRGGGAGAATVAVHAGDVDLRTARG
jgi:acyl carrier protein